MMVHRSLTCGLALLTLWSASTSWAMPASYVYPTVSTHASFSPLLTDSQNRSSQTGAPLASHASLNISHQLGSMVAEAHGQVQPGLIRFFSSSTATAIFEAPLAFGHVLSAAQATVIAGWQDTFTINSESLNGTRGHLVAGFRVDGSFDWTVDPWALTVANPVMDQYYSSMLTLNSGVDSASTRGGQDHRISYPGVEQWGPAPGAGPERAPGLWTIELDFIFGSPLLLQIEGSAHTAAVAFACPGGSPCSLHTFTNSTADFSHTAYWAGLLGVTDAQGNSVSNYTVHSESGFNYRLAAVPIPAAGVLLFTGLTALVGLAARRRS
ncbi:MAG: VPLPA-CTERM sorting domain-containing protein [Nitrospira sp.]|nr:VPLPA-CTERM sorting domain-containing protein [Nitrospira sp.]